MFSSVSTRSRGGHGTGELGFVVRQQENTLRKSLPGCNLAGSSSIGGGHAQGVDRNFKACFPRCLPGAEVAIVRANSGSSSDSKKTHCGNLCQVVIWQEARRLEEGMHRAWIGILKHVFLGVYPEPRWP